VIKKSIMVFCVCLSLFSIKLYAITPYTACTDKLTKPLHVKSSGWSNELEQTRNMLIDKTALEASELPFIKTKWAFGFKDAEQPRSLPAITKQAIFIGSQEGILWALDRHTGCVYWHFQARKKIRSAVTAIDRQDQSFVFFGDDDGYAYALDGITGELAWEKEVDAHRVAVITGSPVYHEGFLYVPASSMEVTQAMNPFYNCCTFRGSLSKLDVLTGEHIWKYFTIPEPPQKSGSNALGVKQFAASGAPVWSSPTIDVTHRRLFIGTGQNYSSPTDSNSDAIHAVDMDTGERIWRSQFLAMDGWNAACQLGLLGTNCPKEGGPDYDFGAPPILVTGADGQQRIIAGQKSGMVYAIHPDTGQTLWSRSVGRGGMLGGVHWGMAADEQAVYVPISDADITFVTSPPGAPQPSLSKLDIVTGDTVWQVPAKYACTNEKGDRLKGCRSGISAAITLIPGAVIAPGLDGVIHAYAREDGRELWQWDTTPSVKTVNGVEAQGGTLDAGGVVVVDGQLFLNSGYGGLISAGGRPGNVFMVLGK
jgi:polyvinyl alcohol dehydrogenase (cytochrome)